MAKIVIINTGCANINSVKFALQRLGVNPVVSDCPQQILAADKVLLPGVGSATEAMAALNAKKLIEPIQDITQPLLGICLGMQLLADFSTEQLDNSDNMPCPCLGKMATGVTKLATAGLPLPHMGWNQVCADDQHPLFYQIENNSHFYFVHSYAMPIGAMTIARSEHGQAFSAAVQKNNFYGVQFHPERSGKTGAQLLRNFLNL